MPVCIVGMHRSGTSMITRLLHLCGLYLGEEHDLLEPDSGILNVKREDNPEGYWENTQFLLLNEQILHLMNGTSYEPPLLSPGWAEDQRLHDLRLKAQAIYEQFQGRPWWGWKDPRNTLTIEFWRTLIPDLKIIVCLRNPLEVTESLIQREQGETREFSLNLWLRYYEQFFQTVGQVPYLITDYAAYFYNADAELRRLLAFLDVKVDESLITRALESISPQLHRKALPLNLLQNEHEVSKYYLRLAREAGPIYEAMNTDPNFQRSVLEKGSAYLFSRVEGLELQLEREKAEKKQAREKLTLCENNLQTLKEEKREHEKTLQALKEEKRGAEEKYKNLMESRISQEEQLAALMLAHESQRQQISNFAQQLDMHAHQWDELAQVLHTPDIRFASKILFRAIVPLKVRLFLREVRSKPSSSP